MNSSVVQPSKDIQHLDAEQTAQDFPLLRPGDGSVPIAYLDSAATSQKPRAVLDAMEDMYLHANANVHRGVYTIAAEATARFERSREIVRGFLNASSPREVIFTSGATASINLLAYSWGLDNLGPGDIVVLSQLEHHSNLVPWQQLAARAGARVEYLPVDEHGIVQLDQLDKIAERGRVRAISIVHVSNSIGTIVPIEKVAAWARENDALTFVDGCQAAPHRAVDVAALGIDAYAFSGHKMLGPTGIGVLWAREELLNSMSPFLFGGEMIRRVEWDSATFNDLPWKFEAGTPAFVEAVGLGAAIEYLGKIGMESIHQHEVALTKWTRSQLETVPGLTILGPPANVDRAGILSFVVEGTHPHDMASILSDDGVAIRAGHHCTQPLLREMGHAATARASVYLYTTESDIERLVAGLHRVRRIFGLES